MLHVAYYISGHGYGHAVRSIEIIRSMAQKNPFYFFHIKTSAPDWLFPLNLEGNYTLYHQEIDVGTVQHSFHEVDKIATLEKLRKFFSSADRFIERELHFFSDVQVQLVLGDIPPLAFAAAYEAGIPAIAIGNFSWDWIYDAYAQDIPGFAEMVEKVQECYQKADLLLRLPFHGPTPAFRAVKDIGLVARKARRKATGVRKMLRLPNSSPPLVLIALRPEDLERVDFDRLAGGKRYQFLVLGRKTYTPHALNLPQDLMPFPELVNAADVVVSKPGYGIVSECIANKTPLVYTSRKDFPEYDVLVEGLKAYAVSAYIPPDDFFRGNWHEPLERVLQQTWDRPDLPVTGAQEATSHIHRFLAQIISTGAA